ncbi:MAG: right-handed parallel beta-helix repeat-containing protein, partial [Thermoplasmata archaeon]|nr:right-handed parallel beta-helix repeat-containing protein [Thermoplasmata archaeon]
GRPRRIAVVLVPALLLLSGFAQAEAPRSPTPVVPSGVLASLTIRADGTVSAAGILGVVGSTYTLLAPYAGSIADERNGSVLSGANHLLTYTSGTATVIVYDAVNVTVTGFNISSTASGIEVLNSSQVAVLTNTIVTTATAVVLVGSSDVTVANTTAPSTQGFTVDDSTTVVVMNNNFSHSTFEGGVVSRLTGLVLTGNDLSSPKQSAFTASYLASFRISGNQLQAAGSTGAIALDYASQGNISSNNMTSEAYPVGIAEGTNISLWNNTVSSATNETYFATMSTGISIVDSVALRALYSAAYFVQDVGVTLLRDDFRNGGDGVHLDGTSQVRIIDSRVGGGPNSVYVNGGGNVTITGSDLSNGNNGLYAIGSSSIVVRDSDLSRANYPLNLTGGTRNVVVANSSLDGAQLGGAYLNNVSAVSLENCTIRTAAEYGIYSIATHGLSVVDTNLSGTALRPEVVGIETSGDTNVALVNDSIAWTQSPITDAASNGILIRDTDVSNATLAGSGVALYLDQNILVQRTNFFNDTGQGLDGSNFQNLTVNGSDFGQLQSDGLNLASGTGIRLTGNTFDNEGGLGVYMSVATDFVASGNRLNNDSYAFFLQGGTDFVLTGNTAIGDRDGGLSANSIQGLVLAGNNFSNDGAANLITLELLAVEGLAVNGNTFGLDNEALYLEGMTGGVVVGNTFSNDNISIDVNGPVLAQIYHNDFVADGKYVLAGGPVLTWDNGYPSGGNFWSNYSGGDRFSGVHQDVAGADGIGDTPMVLNATEVDRYPLMSPWADHAAVFLETGLPLGTPWVVVINGTAHPTQSIGVTIVSALGVDSPYAFTIPNVGGFAATPSSGSGVLGSGLVVVNVAFARPTYSVTFNEVGLPEGTTWSVAVNGTTSTGSGPTLTQALPNGSYAYSIAPISGFTGSPRAGSVTVTGAAGSVGISFAPFTFAVHVVETGLSAGASWSVVIGTNTSTSSNGSLDLRLTNGSYPFRVVAPSGFDATPSGGSWTVSGGPVTVYLDFAASSTGTAPGNPLLTRAVANALPYYLAILILAVVAALGWVLALRRRGESKPPSVTPPSPPPGVG